MVVREIRSVVFERVERSRGNNPACRNPPPYICLKRLARSMKADRPARAEPTGAPSPLEKHTFTVSHTPA